MINNVGLGGLDTSKNPKIIEFGVWGLQNNEIAILLYQSEAAKSYGAFWTIFSYYLHHQKVENGAKNYKSRLLVIHADPSKSGI